MRIFADFNNMDPDGHLRLNLTGTTEDLVAAGIDLVDGLSLLVSDGDLFAEIVVVKPGREGVWRGKIIHGPWEGGDHRDLL